MHQLPTAVFLFMFLTSVNGLEVLRSSFQLKDGRKLIYRFETQDSLIGAALNQGQIVGIARNWAARFYESADLDLLDTRSRVTPISFWLVSFNRKSDYQTVYAVILADGSIVEPFEDHTMPNEDLITLARLKFTEFTCAEERTVFEKLINKTQVGEPADFTPDPSAGIDLSDQRILTDPVYAGLWAKKRILRAEWLNWLCKDPKASALVTSRGIEIAGARVDGCLDLAWAKIPFPVRATGCAFAEDIIMDQSSIRCLQLRDTAIKGLHADGLTVERDVLFTEGFRAERPIHLQSATIGGSLQCNKGRFDGGDAGERDEQLPEALYLKQAKIAGGLYLENVEAKGVVQLEDAVIGGDLDCEGAHFDGFASHPAKPDNALFAPSMKVGENARFCRSWNTFNDFDANGEMVFRNATIGGNLDCYGGHFSNPNYIAIDALSVKVGADIWLRWGFSSVGEIILKNAIVGGNLDCDGGQFENAGGNALTASSASIQGNVLLRAYREDEQARGFVRLRKDHKKEAIDFAVNGNLVFLAATVGGVLELNPAVPLKGATLDLQDAKAGTLFNGENEMNWPDKGHLKLHNFVYNVIDNRGLLKASAQLAWLRLQPGFFPQPYEQTATVLRNMGHREDAVEVMIAKNDELSHHTNGFGEFFWYRVFGPVIGYGYRPWKAFWISLVVILLGWWLFWLGYRTGLVTPTERRQDLYPQFSAFVYSLETFVPLVKLQVSQYWLPNADRGKAVPGLRELMLKAVVQLLLVKNLKEYWFHKLVRTFKIRAATTGAWLRTYLWWHIIAGWVFTTLWVVGLTGLVKT